MRHVAYITGTRADYGLMSCALFAIKNNTNFKLSVVATGMHLMPKFGKTVERIKKEGFDVYEIRETYKRDDKASASEFIGNLIYKLTCVFKRLRPDIILLLGDRAEMLAGAIVGAYMGIPVVHIHGGEVTSTVDELARHAITKLSHIHLVANKKSADRIKKIGEDSWRIYVSGAPGLDAIVNDKLLPKATVFKKLCLTEKIKTVIVLQHPVTAEIDMAATQMKETLDAINALDVQAVIIYPNSDAGGRKIIDVIDQYKKKHNGGKRIRVFRSMERNLFLSLMKHADVMIGNSSSGIIEAPSFYLPVVNIGTRQEGREQTKNIINVKYDSIEIKKAIKKAFTKNFKDSIKKIKNPYGDGKTGEKITKILESLNIEDSRLIQKKLTY